MYGYIWLLDLYSEEYELELYDEDIKNMRDIDATRKFDEKRLPGGSRTYRKPPIYAFTSCKRLHYIFTWFASINDTS